MKTEILKELETLLAESIRLYEVNGKQPYEAGRVDGGNDLVTTPPDKSGSFSATLRNKPKPKAPSELF